MQVPLLDLTGQYRALKPEIMRVIESVCDSQRFILGEKVAEFEKQAAAYCRTADAVGVTSGSDALIIALMDLNIWKFMVHVLLKPGLENFEHYFTSM